MDPIPFRAIYYYPDPFEEANKSESNYERYWDDEEFDYGHWGSHRILSSKLIEILDGTSLTNQLVITSGICKQHFLEKFKNGVCL